MLFTNENNYTSLKINEVVLIKWKQFFLLISPWALAGVCIAARGLHLHVTSGAGKKRHVAAIVGENGGPERTTHHPQTMRGHSDEDEQASILEKKTLSSLAVNPYVYSPHIF